MNQDVKVIWANALRSKQYKQGRNYLRRRSAIDPDSHQYCCLGVLCDLYIKQDPENRGWEEGEECSFFHDRYDLLPPSVSVWSRVTSCEEKFLATLNDAGESFERIADWIDENL